MVPSSKAFISSPRKYFSGFRSELRDKEGEQKPLVALEWRHYCCGMNQGYFPEVNWAAGERIGQHYAVNSARAPVLRGISWIPVFLLATQKAGTAQAS